MSTRTEQREDLDFFFAACEEQDFEDARLTAEGYTGAARDLSTSDYSAWLCGTRLGWAKSPSAAEDLIREQLTREIDHRTIPA